MSAQCASTGSDRAAVAGFRSLVSSLVAGAGVAEVVVGPGECLDLVDRLLAVSDGRGEQGRAHPVAAVLTLAAAAVVAGMKSLTESGA